MFEFYYKLHRTGLITFCGTEVKVDFDINGGDCKFTFREYDNGYYKHTNPVTRHPAVLAASASSLNQLTGGRFWLGIGSSTKMEMQPIGVRLKGQVPRCREAVIIIRQLLEEGHSNLEGEIFRTCSARPLFEEANSLPVLVGAGGGPKMLHMSGEVANGVIFPAATVVRPGGAVGSRPRPGYTGARLPGRIP